MRASFPRSSGVFVLLLAVAGCGGDNRTSSKDGGAGKGGEGGATGKAGGGGQAAKGGAGGTGAGTAGAGGGAGAGGAAGAGTAGAGGGAGAGGAAGAGNGGGAGTAADAGLDLSGITPPAMLTATVLDRRATTFELVWTAPSDNGAAVTGYQVRYAKVPITATNFDDTTMTTAVTYTGTPKAPGDTDGMVVKAYIENGYYFAVTGTDAGGTHVGAFMATTTAVAAHFNVTRIPSTSGLSELLGAAVSGDGDLNGDGLSDIVGSTIVGRVYIYFGASNFPVPTAPSVTITGSSSGFGYAVAQIGDIDNDGLPDLAISDATSAGEKVFIYKGRTNWPVTLTDTQADYVISTDASYANSFFGFWLARLGDFTGDNVDDFAIGARGYNGNIGRVIVIPGKATGFSSVALPDTANAIIIDGDSSLGTPFFGYKVLGLGHFYSVSTGTTLIASGPRGASDTPSSAGRVYAFHGQTGTSGAISISAADNLLVGLAASAKIGSALTNLGTMLDGFPGVGVGNTLDTTGVSGANGTGYLTSGSPATGPFANKIVTYLTGATQGGNVIVGGGLPGRDVQLSLIGDGTPDLVFAGQSTSILTISDGAKIGAKTSPVELSSTAEVTLALPTGWFTGNESATIVPDVDGDHIPDFCIGSDNQPGSVLVYW
jgi:FG-GAP-like repeat